MGRMQDQLGWGAILTLVLMLTGATGLPGADRAAASPRDEVMASYTTVIRPLLSTYCGDCHSADRHKGDLDLSPLLERSGPLDQAVLWRKVAAKVASSEMPPAKAKDQPSDSDRLSLLSWLKACRRLQAPNPGISVIRRLARLEYTNTINDLFGVTLDAGADLPPDNPGEGFDNSLSPLLGEKYLLAADAVLDRYIVPDQLNLHLIAGQLPAVVAGQAVEGKPDGMDRTFTTPGEVLTAVTIPADGTYTIHLKAGAEAAGGEPIRLAIRLDGKVVSEVRIIAPLTARAAYTCTAHLNPGRLALSILYANPLMVAADPAPAPGAPKSPAAAQAPTSPVHKDAKPATPKIRSVEIESIDIVGPPAKSPSEVQRRLFIAQPGKGLSRHEAAQRIIEPFAERAYRRPLLPEELMSLMAIFDFGDAQDLVFNESIQLTFKAILISPQFLYRTPELIAGERDKDITEIGDFELATRLSYFLWSTMPDEELLRVAKDHTLHHSEVLAAQTQRLIKDPRARNLAETFAAPWLYLDKLSDLTVDEKRFPQMTKEMRQAMYEEGIAFFLGMLHEGGSVVDILDCDYAYMNGLTARIYGNAEVKGPKMQKVHLSDENRGGVITMPGVLAVTSMPSRTSPVKRGKFILEQLLNAAPPPPPANVPDLSKQDTAENAKLTLRQRTERHRTDPACAACHRVMDPLGFGLENFDAIGRWRDVDDYGASVDALGELPGRQHFNSPAELRKILLGHKEQFVRAFAGKLLAFALGRQLSGYDEVVVDDLADGLVAHGCRLDDLIMRIVSSYPFTHRHSLN
jgi:hypothetical protein